MFRSSKKIITKGVKGNSWEEKLAVRRQVEMEKSLLAELKANRAVREETEKARREARRKRKAANATRVQNTHQVITNSRKLKRMGKKQRERLVKK